MAEAVIVEDKSSPAENPVVAVGFQKDLRRAHKYLEAEPKALGVTQIILSLFQITCVVMFFDKDLSQIFIETLFLIGSVLVMVAGNVALAAQNLRLPTLKACLGMQILASAASLLNIILTSSKMGFEFSTCWYYGYGYRGAFEETCQKIQNIRSHLFAECMVIHAVLFAISTTLAAYCCKVVNCCTPQPKMTVITLQAPAVQP